MARRNLVYMLIVLICSGIVGILYMNYGSGNGYFRTPLDIPLQLAANFGELRNDHFHMGLDIRTNGREGLPVYAAADGYISHIRIEQYGLGKALFIAHPNGCTTVYGHLSQFTADLEKYIRKQQYTMESWEQDLDLSAGQFPVRKGQLIAYSGNTGASLAPHLHFEIRDSKTGASKNPLLEGFHIPDNIPPAITGLYWYDRRYSTYETRAQKITIIGKDGHYHSVGDIIKVGTPLVSLGISASDKGSNSPHLSGIYHAALWLDDKLIFAFDLRDFSGMESRYINACIDYYKWIRSGRYVQHLSILPGNHLPIFSSTGEDGIIHLTDTRVHMLRVEVSDVYDNRSDLTMKICFDDSRQLAEDGQQDGSQTARIIFPGHAERLNGQSVRARFSKDAFYDPVHFVLQETPQRGSNKASSLIQLHDPTVPVHDCYAVQVRTTLAVGSSLRQHVVMQLISGDSQVIVKGTWRGDWMTGSFNRLGDLQLLIDTISPTIEPQGWTDGQVFSADSPSLTLFSKDDLGMVGTFRAELDGHWVPFARKGGCFTYTFDENCPRGSHKLNVVVKDVAGNQTQRVFQFVNK